MKAKKRYLLLLVSVAFLALCVVGVNRLKRGGGSNEGAENWKRRRKRLTDEERQDPRWIREGMGGGGGGGGEVGGGAACRLETCFDFSRCTTYPYKHYIHPVDEKVKISQNYQKVLDILRSSPFYTTNPDEACLFILSLDTLNRDKLSDVGYVGNLPSRLENLPLWNRGTNHIVFNLYSGTYPDYTEDLGFDIGRAMLAKASIAHENYRDGFDVSIPLFHSVHPERGGMPGKVISDRFPVIHRYFLAFKGKRYVYGIGSDTRNSLHHLHNGQDIVLVTTCKHGKNWKELKDDRCDRDNQEFDRWDYDLLLSNSTFCMVPRGRRLGSFRFIETLQAGCVPVLLSNGWQLPFGEVIDWSAAVIDADERLLMQVPEILHSVPPAKIFAMRQQTQMLWDRYLSSVEKIVMTTLEIVHDRIRSHQARDGLIWNSDPGALLVRSPEFADSISQFPFEHFRLDSSRCVSPSSSSSLMTKEGCYNDGLVQNFTAVIFTQLPNPTFPNAPIFRLIRNISRSPFVAKILVLWSSKSSQGPPPLNKWPTLPRKILQIKTLPPGSSLNERFRMFPEIETNSILSLNDDSILTTDEIDFAFHVWNMFPDRIVGYPARSHYWNVLKNQWSFSSKWTNDYSMVLTSGAFYHRYYHYLYSETLSPVMLKTVEQSGICEDILMNFLVSHVTKRSPIKLSHRGQIKAVINNPVNRPSGTNPEFFHERQNCMNTFASLFGYMPLKKSKLRLDPVLFKDQVANTRKKYRQMEFN